MADFLLQPRGREFEHQPGYITLVEIGHEIISKGILSLREGQLSVTGESMCTKYCLTAWGLSLPRNSLNRSLSASGAQLP